MYIARAVAVWVCDFCSPVMRVRRGMQTQMQLLDRMTQDLRELKDELKALKGLKADTDAPQQPYSANFDEVGPARHGHHVAAANSNGGSLESRGSGRSPAADRSVRRSSSWGTTRRTSPGRIRSNQLAKFGHVTSV